VTEIEDAERAVSSLQDTPRGLLRVTTPVGVSYLGPVVSDFLRLYPEVRVEVSCTGRVVDLIDERFDVAIRAGALSDSTLVARPLGAARWFLVATPAYLKKRGRPKSPEDLKAHECLLFGTAQNATTLRLQKGDGWAQVSLSPRLLVGDMEVLNASALAGLGIALLPAFLCVAELRARKLECVLRDWEAPPSPMNVVYPTARYVSPKVKAFVDHLQRHMSPPPWELGPLP
jgi:DNA-binding transcriptional LysR family regulator